MHLNTGCPAYLLPHLLWIMMTESRTDSDPQQ
uniref:Uncharacterized protein n=1 Tax=Arundo donax TaxID=35708 RepID=A0A0A9A9E1_ARUDO